MSFFILNVFLYAKCLYAECLYAECRYTECHGAVRIVATIFTFKFEKHLVLPSIKWPTYNNQETLTEREGLVQLTSLYELVFW